MNVLEQSLIKDQIKARLLINTLLLLTLFLVVGCSSENNSGDNPILDLENLTDQQLISGTVLGLRQGLSGSIEILRGVLSDSDAMSEAIALISDNSNQKMNLFASQGSKNTLANNHWDFNLDFLARFPKFVEFVVNNSSVTSRQDNRFSLDPNEATICAPLLDRETDRCRDILSRVLLEATVNQQDNGAVVAATINVLFDQVEFLKIDYSSSAASLELLLTGVKTVLAGIAEIDTPGEPSNLPETIQGNLLLSIESIKENKILLTLSTPQTILIKDGTKGQEISFELPATDDLFSLTADRVEQSLFAQIDIPNIKLRAFDDDENGVFPINLELSGITGSAALSDAGETLVLQGIGLNNLLFELDEVPTITFQLADFDAALQTHSDQRPSLTLETGFESSLVIQNTRGYFEDLFESANPDLRREIGLSISQDSVFTKVAESVLKIENGAVNIGVSFDGQDPIALELTDGSCLDLESIDIVNCPIFSVSQEVSQ